MSSPLAALIAKDEQTLGKPTQLYQYQYEVRELEAFIDDFTHRRFQLGDIITIHDNYEDAVADYVMTSEGIRLLGDQDTWKKYYYSRRSAFIQKRPEKYIC